MTTTSTRLKYIFLSTIVALFALMVFTGGSVHAEPLDFDFKPARQTLEPGDTFEVELIARTNGDKVQLVLAEVEWQTNRLDFNLSCNDTRDSDFTSIINISSGSNKRQIAGIFEPDQSDPQRGALSLCKLKFKVKTSATAGTSTISINKANSAAIDGDNQIISNVKSQNARIVVEIDEPVVATSPTIVPVTPLPEPVAPNPQVVVTQPEPTPAPQTNNTLDLTDLGNETEPETEPEPEPIVDSPIDTQTDTQFTDREPNGSSDTPDSTAIDDIADTTVTTDFASAGDGDSSSSGAVVILVLFGLGLVGGGVALFVIIRSRASSASYPTLSGTTSTTPFHTDLKTMVNKPTPRPPAAPGVPPPPGYPTQAPPPQTLAPPPPRPNQVYTPNDPNKPPQ